MGGAFQLQVWVELGQGAFLFPSRVEVPQRARVVFTCFTRFAHEFHYSIYRQKNLS